MPTVDQITERFKRTVEGHPSVLGATCLTCIHSRKTRACLPGEMVCQLDDTKVGTRASCVAWVALYQGGAL